MAGYISEFFGFRAEDNSPSALRYAATRICPFLNAPCTKILSRLQVPSGCCTIRQKSTGSPDVICCPNRLYAQDYEILREVARLAFKEDLPLVAGKLAVETAKNTAGAIAVFGHGWGGELRLPQRAGRGSYFVDWVLAKINSKGLLVEFTAVEVQTIDTTGNYQTARQALLETREIVPDTVGFNWENVNKRILPQLIYKGQVLQREDLCRNGLYFVAPRPVFDRVLERLGGKGNLPVFPSQPASLHFIAYDVTDYNVSLGEILPLGIVDSHDTTVYKVQESFSNLNLPGGNVYREALLKALYT